MSDRPPIPPGTPLAVTLTYQQWRELVDVLADAPFRKVSHFVGAIDRQCGEQLTRLMPTLRRTNGAGDHADAG